MKLGFTGTRKGLTWRQETHLAEVFTVLPEQMLHGGAEGADTIFDAWYRENASRAILRIDIYPASIGRSNYWAWKYDTVFPWVTIHPPMPPLERNKIIAYECDVLLACPADPDEQLRSGTWATVRYARKLGRQVILLLPDGSITRELPRFQNSQERVW